MLKYSDEEIIEFEKSNARFIKFEVLSTVVDEYGRSEYYNKGCIIGVISLLRNF